jgi:glyoxylase-like metal-dependent hydrolase (beta-lactamase superfamily II)
MAGAAVAGVERLNPVFGQLGLQVLQRGWLSSNNIVFSRRGKCPATVVDTGYDSHAQQTADLVSTSLGAAPLERVVNTHLHSDHCGGNAALQAASACEVWVPEVSLASVAEWDESRLTFEQTGQTCQRFIAHGALEVGNEVVMGGYPWAILRAPGHDAEAVMFFQRESRVLISGDALWEDRLAIIFSALQSTAGFADTRSVLADIEAIDPRIVIPGHGAPFSGVAGAIAASRRRLDAFEADPCRHLQYAARALTMFHMLEVRRLPHHDLIDWLRQTPIFQYFTGRSDGGSSNSSPSVESVVARLVADGLLLDDHGDIHLPNSYG